MKKIVKIIGKTVRVLFIVFCVFLLSLFFRSQHLPSWAVERICRALSVSPLVVDCASASIGFRHGLDLSEVRVFDRSREHPMQPVFKAGSVQVSFVRRALRVVEPVFHHLGDDYYRPAPTLSGGGESLAAVRLPSLPRFELEIVGGDILGIRPERLVASVKVSERRAEVERIDLKWPDAERKMRLDGVCTVDFDQAKVEGFVRGFARVSNIRPLLLADTLDMLIAIPYMDAFTDVFEPVDAYCGWSVDLLTRDFSLKLDLHPKLGRYHGVPLGAVDGEIAIDVSFRDGRKEYVTRVGPIVAKNAAGTALEGTIVFAGTNGVDRIEFEAKSRLDKESTLAVIDCLNDGILDDFDYAVPAEVSVVGTLYPEVAHQRFNDLGGTIVFDRGSLFGIPLLRASCSYAYRGDTVFFTNAVARGTRGGAYAGSAAIAVPELDERRARFQVDVAYADGLVEELAEAFGLDIGDRRGQVEGRLRLAGPVATNFVSSLAGDGRLAVRDGNLAQLKLFRGFTEYFTHVISTNLSFETVRAADASADFTITNGIFRSDNVLIEGVLFSIKAAGTYDLVRDELDFRGQVRLLKSGNIASYIVHPVLSVVTSLLAEFRVSGPITDPVWEYYGPLDKLKELFR